MNKRTNNHGFAVVEALFILVVLGAIGWAGWYVFQRQQHTSVASVASAKPQFPSSQTLAGYVTYNPGKFKEVSGLTFPTASSAGADTNVVITQGTLLSKNMSGLYLYDLKANKAYKLTDGGGDPRIMSDHYLIYGFDSGDDANKQLGAKLLDLQSGQTTTVYSDTRTNAPGTACCSVSPDGFKAAIVHKDKLSVWDIRTRSMKDYPVSLNPIGEGFYSGADAPYNVEMSYAKPVWADNSTLLFANKPADRHTADANPTINTDIYSLDTATGKTIEIPTPQSGIDEIWVYHGQPYIDAVDIAAQTETITKIGPASTDKPQLVYASSDGDSLQLAPSGKQVIISGLTMSQQHIFQAYDTDTKTVKDLAYVPAGANAKNTAAIDRGWLDETHMIVEIGDTSYPNPHSYIGITNVVTGKLEQSTQLE